MHTRHGAQTLKSQPINFIAALAPGKFSEVSHCVAMKKREVWIDTERSLRQSGKTSPGQGMQHNLFTPRKGQTWENTPQTPKGMGTWAEAHRICMRTAMWLS